MPTAPRPTVARHRDLESSSAESHGPNVAGRPGRAGFAIRLTRGEIGATSAALLSTRSTYKSSISSTTAPTLNTSRPLTIRFGGGGARFRRGRL
jgi:hypothetical protein